MKLKRMNKRGVLPLIAVYILWGLVGAVGLTTLVVLTGVVVGAIWPDNGGGDTLPLIPNPTCVEGGDCSNLFSYDQFEGADAAWKAEHPGKVPYYKFSVNGVVQCLIKEQVRALLNDPKNSVSLSSTYYYTDATCSESNKDTTTTVTEEIEKVKKEQQASAKCPPVYQVAGKTVLPDVYCLFKEWLADKYSSALSYFDKIKIGFGVLVGLLAYVIGVGFVSTAILGSKKPSVLAHVIALVIGGVVGFIVYLTFWVGVGILVLLSVLKIPRIMKWMGG